MASGQHVAMPLAQVRAQVASQIRDHGTWVPLFTWVFVSGSWWFFLRVVLGLLWSTIESKRLHEVTKFLEPLMRVTPC